MDVEMEEVCYTREAGLAKALEMATNSFESYKEAFPRLQSQAARKLIKEIALQALEHKYTLEKAFFEETTALQETGYDPGPSLQLTVMLEDRRMEDNATDQDIMIYAIHDKKRIVDFFNKMASQCGGAPMEAMFARLAKEAEGNLNRLEELYESVYMPDN